MKTEKDNASDTSQKGRHKTSLRIPLHEVDLGQGVYHGNYFHLFDLARDSFWRDLGHPYRTLMDQRLHLTIVELSCSYKNALHYDDIIEIHTGVEWLRSRSLAMRQTIYRSDGKESPTLCAEAVFNMVCIRFSGQPTLIPTELAELLKVSGIASRG
ncbi:MAG: acyl-CoA thioesterase [Syntrophobacteraceae bacterium]